MAGASAPRWREALAAAAVLLAHALMQVHLAWEDSPTIDEPGHVAAALAYTRQGAFRVYNVNPPLARLVQGAFLLATPLDTSMIAEPERIDGRNEMGVGGMFADAHAADYRRLLWLARLGTVAFALLGGVLVWWWAELAFGRPCGLVALAAWCCDPSVLANGHLATPDVPAAVMALAAALALRGYLAAPGWQRAALFGAVLGLAQLTKFTLLLLYPAAFTFWVAAWARGGAEAQSRSLAVHGLLALALSLLVLNAGYVFQDTARRLETFRFLSSKMARFAPETIDSLAGPTNARGGTWAGAVPVPLPAAYVEGIDLQARDFDRYAVARTRFFVAGQWHEGGRYYYYLYGVLVKWPLALFGLLGVAALMLRPCGPRRLDLALLVVVPLAVLALVSSQKGMNKHVRYVLPMLPFVVVLAGAAGRAWQGERRWPRLAVSLLLGWLLLAGMRASRDPLAYFNEAAGGPRGGARHLAGSNLDWGQGRHRLRAWLEARPDFRPVGVVCYGGEEADFAGLEGLTKVPREPQPGRFAVSVRFIQGDAGVAPSGLSYAYFQRFEPIATVGDSVWVFDISLEEANRARAEMGLAPLEGP